MRTQQSGRMRWVLCALALGLIAAALRRWQLATAFGGELNLAIPMAPASVALGCTLVIAGALFCILAAWQQVAPPPRGERGKGRWDRAMSAPGDAIGLTVMVLASFLMLAAAPLLFWDGLSMWQGFQNSMEKIGNNGVLVLATAVTSVVGFVGLLVAGQAAYRAKGRGKGAIVLPAVNGCLWLMELYRGHAADPVLWDYVPMLLAIVAGMLMYMDWGGLSTGRPRPRRTLWLAGMTVVLTAVALAGQWQWGEGLLLLSQLVTAFVVLFRLPVNLEHPTWAARVSIPEQERPWRGEDMSEEDEDQRVENEAQEIQEEGSHE